MARRGSGLTGIGEVLPGWDARTAEAMRFFSRDGEPADAAPVHDAPRQHLGWDERIRDAVEDLSGGRVTVDQTAATAQAGRPLSIAVNMDPWRQLADGEAGLDSGIVLRVLAGGHGDSFDMTLGSAVADSIVVSGTRDTMNNVFGVDGQRAEFEPNELLQNLVHILGQGHGVQIFATRPEQEEAATALNTSFTAV